jgi:hypothetical protein
LIYPSKQTSHNVIKISAATHAERERHTVEVGHCHHSRNSSSELQVNSCVGQEYGAVLNQCLIQALVSLLSSYTLIKPTVSPKLECGGWAQNIKKERFLCMGSCNKG